MFKLSLDSWSQANNFDTLSKKLCNIKCTKQKKAILSLQYCQEWQIYDIWSVRNQAIFMHNVRIKSKSYLESNIKSKIECCFRQNIAIIMLLNVVYFCPALLGINDVNMVFMFACYSAIYMSKSPEYMLGNLKISYFHRIRTILLGKIGILMSSLTWYVWLGV